MFTLNALRAFRMPLPKQGEGEGEGSSKTRKPAEIANPSPQSSPLIEGERREEPRALWRESRRSKRRTNRWALRIHKAVLLTRNLRAAVWIAALRGYWSLLPRQGEGEGEGKRPSTATKRGKFGNPSPQSSPLLRGERRHAPRGVWRECGRSERTKNRRLFWSGKDFRLPAGLWSLTLLVAAITPAAANSLPIYIEDNHAGTFYWLAQNIDLDQTYTLILFDAHSDASGIFDSDKIRGALRSVVSTQDRKALLDRWRRKGAVQCFNWIEPLMPAPIEKVIWVPAENLSASQVHEYRQQATALLDGHLEAAPRKSGSLQEAYIVSDFEHLEKEIDPNQRLIVTIDLDYFAGLAAAEQEQAFARIWNFVIKRPNLSAITFAISRPYLNSELEANGLLKLAFASALSLPTAQIEFEPFLTVANDHSNLAKKLMMKGEKPPGFDVAHSTQDLRARILSERERINVWHDAARWQQLLRTWNDEGPLLRLEVKNRDASTDDVWRVPADDAADIQLVVEPWTAKPEKIEWFALTPKFWRCNLTDLSSEQVGFVANAAPRPAWNELAIDCHDSVLPITKIEALFDRRLHCGSVRLRARAVVDGKVRETPVMELRRFIGSGFRAALTEQFGLPYLFGSGGLSEFSDTGPEINLGADCANFVVYALRRQGQRIPWSDPKRLRKHLDLVTRSATPGMARITAEDVQRGIIVHLGTHVAAVIEDRNPMGILDENDFVAHQLPVAPEIVTLGQLLKERKMDRFDLYRAPSAKSTATLIFGGDIMLGRSCAAKIQKGADPFEGISSLVRQASFAAANLECTISNLGGSTNRYAFRAPAESAQLLRRAGFDAMGLANNHSLDFGPVALHDSAAHLVGQTIEPIGVEKSNGSPYAPRFFSMPGGNKLALLAVSDIEPNESSQIARASDRTQLGAAIANARSQANLVVCLVHWGIENTERITAEQRELARWLIERGVDLVVGSHPHCVQRLDFYHGCPIAYSLGNLVFDGARTIASWNHGALLEVGLNENAQASSARLIPLVLEDGFPRTDVDAGRNSLSSR
jgi:poly-gamma-glutamate capsule biosynthesis protein CapA/YwtB (metallophosphatase superfamily)